MRPVAIVLALGLLLAAVLVVRLALDFTQLAPGIGVVVWLFAAAFLGLVGAQASAAWRAPRGATRPELSRAARAGLALSIPFALAGSQLDCMGTIFAGCHPACGFLSSKLAPAVALAALLHAFAGWGGFALAALVLAFPLLVPNCTCRNPVNAYWIELLGKSPACYASSFAVVLTATSALLTRRLVVPALVLCWSVVAVLAAFWVGHHYFDWPW